MKIGLKIFLTSDNEELLKDALETGIEHTKVSTYLSKFLVFSALQQLNVNSVADVILSFKKEVLDDKKDNLNEIKKAWKYLESYVDRKVVGELGIADIEENTFRYYYYFKVCVIEIF